MSAWTKYVEARAKLEAAAKIEGVFEETDIGGEFAVEPFRSGTLRVEAPTETLPEIARWLVEVAIEADGYLTVSPVSGRAEIMITVKLSEIPQEAAA